MQIANYTRSIISAKNMLFAADSNGVIKNPETYSHDWTCTNAQISVVSDKTVYPLQYSFKIQPLDDSSPIVFSLHGIIPVSNQINGSEAQFHAQLYGQKEINYSIQLKNVTTATASSHGDISTAQVWHPMFSPVVDVTAINLDADDIEFDVDITFTQHGGTVFYVALPTLMNEFGFTGNTFVFNMRKFLPTFIWDKDKIQEYPNYPFTKLLHALTRSADLSTKLYSKYYGYLNGEISVKNKNSSFRHSQLVHPEHVYEDYADWLSQFNGTPMYRTVKTSTNTEAIQDEEDSITWQLKNAYFGRNAGTLEAIKECTKQVLSGEKIVLVFPGGQFFQINVYTLLSETPGVSQNGDTSPEVVAMIEKTKPMGFVLNHEAYDALPLILDDPTYGLLNTAPLA